MALHQYLSSSTQSHADFTAVIEPDRGEISYANLNSLSNRVRDRLLHSGIERGDRVGIVLHKTIDAVACIFGTLKSGAAYVPVDVTGPISRTAYILTDCSVKVAFVENSVAQSLNEEIIALGGNTKIIVLDNPTLGKALQAALDQEDKKDPAPATVDCQTEADDLAYILYTSGSTGKPKGVPLTHKNGMAYVEWCSRKFAPRQEDLFSAHAPFHFDLSILDLYTPIKHGAAIVLIGEALGKEPARLAEVIESTKITVWYSAPSILTMLVQFGGIESKDLSQLRTIIFAGEVFPVKHLRALLALLPKPKYYNLYGPTETNVCTYQPVPENFLTSEQSSLPIGPVCEHLSAKVVDEEGEVIKRGETGELIISGDNVMQGYWNLPEQTEKAFFKLPNGRYYRTGDLVIEDEKSAYTYVGRRDRMIKKRGFRVELGEIEAKLHLHPEIVEAAVIAISDDEGTRVHAHFVTLDNQRLSVIKLKKFCSEQLPLYMVPDTFVINESIPKTSTDKTDYQALIKTHGNI